MSNYKRVKEVAKDLHYNRQESTLSNEAATASNDLRQESQRLDSLILYIPESINIDEHLNEKPLDVPNARDKLLYILHLINSIPSKRKDLDLSKNQGFTPINKKTLQKRIYHYRDCINYLKERGIITESYYYKVGKTSQGLKFSPRFNSTLTPIEITTKTLIKSITKRNDRVDLVRTEELYYLKKWFSDGKLQIDITKSIKYLQNLTKVEKENGNPYPIQKFNFRLLPALKINLNDISFFVDNTSGRLHTPLAHLKSELRQFISYEGETLVSIDIINSQPFFATALLDDTLFINNGMDISYNSYLSSPPNNPIMVVDLIRSKKECNDVQCFNEIVRNGTFYEEFAQLISNNELSEQEIREKRPEVKKIVFSAFFSPNQSISYNEELRVFKETFPNVYDIFSHFKRVDHTILAKMLQRVESQTILHKVCKRISLENPNVPIFTIHDSIVTTSNNVEFVSKVFSDVLQENLGYSPKFEIKEW